MLGIVKWFNSTKSYGFVTSDDDQRDYFFHYKSIIMDGYKSLRDGQKVSFDADEENEKGMKAKNIRKIDQ